MDTTRNPTPAVRSGHCGLASASRRSREAVSGVFSNFDLEVEGGVMDVEGGGVDIEVEGDGG